MASIGLSILTPYTANYVGGRSTLLGKYKSTTTKGLPIFLGSIQRNTVLQPGKTLSINEFGLDVDEISWECRTSLASSVKPEPRDRHPSLTGMYCVSSVVTDGEGLMSTVRATYKGLVRGKVRPAQRQCTCDTRTDTVKLADSIVTSTGGEGAGAHIPNIQNVPVPQPVFTLRGATPTEPDMTQLNRFFPSPPRAPKVSTYFQWTIFYGSMPLVYLNYLPDPRGWFCDKLEWQEAGLNYEVTQQFRHDYVYAGVSLPDAPPV